MINGMTDDFVDNLLDVAYKLQKEGVRNEDILNCLKATRYWNTYDEKGFVRRKRITVDLIEIEDLTEGN